MSKSAIIRSRPWCDRLSLALAALVVFASALVVFASHADAQSVRPPESAVTNATPSPGGGAAPGLPKAPGEELGVRGVDSDSDLWRAVRVGEMFETQKRGANAGMLVQSEGSVWQQMRDGPLAQLGLAVLGGMLVILVLFYLLRGRIRVDHGLAGRTMLRFDAIERFGHWLLASSFIVLAISGLSMLYGRDALIPIVGKEAFATFMVYAKLSHNYLAFAFMAGLALTFVLWVAHNIPSKHDIKWLMVAGGLFSKNVHPPARKFNAGQKFIFWSTMLGGLVLSISGWALLFPFEYAFFAPVFETVNGLGLALPTTLTPMQEMQLAQLLHGLAGAVMIAIIVAHIYIGSVGMEGAFDAMGSGEVDVNWAREHHGLWVKEVEERERGRGHAGVATPAE